MNKTKTKRLLYHATDADNLAAILTEGIKPGWEGGVFATTKPAHAVRFLAFRTKADPSGATVTLPDGRVVPNRVPITRVVVVELKVDADRVTESFDHSPMFFGEDVEAVIVEGAITPRDLTYNAWEYTLGFDDDTGSGE